MPPPEMGPAGPCPSLVAHGCQPPCSRRDPVIPRPPPRPLPRLAHWCWLRKATFQRPPATRCQPRILGRAGGRAGGSWGGLWEGPESEHLSTGCERNQARDRAGTTPPFQGLHLWPAHPHPSRSLGGGQRLTHGGLEKTHPFQVAKFLFHKRFSRQSSHLLCDLGQTHALSGPQRLTRGPKQENREGALQPTVFIIPSCCDFSLLPGLPADPSPHSKQPTGPPKSLGGWDSPAPHPDEGASLRSGDAALASSPSGPRCLLPPGPAPLPPGSGLLASRLPQTRHVSSLLGVCPCPSSGLEGSAPPSSSNSSFWPSKSQLKCHLSERPPLTLSLNLGQPPHPGFAIISL